MDAVVVAHGNATRAVVEADLAKSLWEVRYLETFSSYPESGSKLANVFVNTSILRLRLFSVDGAYADLQRANSLGASDPRLAMLTRYVTQLKGPRDSEFLAGVDLSNGSSGGDLLRRLQKTFLRNSYETSMVLRASRASSMSEFIFVDGRADQLEHNLLQSIDEPNPMKPDPVDPAVPTELVDLIRIFLLRHW